MIIEKNIQKYVVLSGETISNALKKIEHNKKGFVCVVGSDGVLVGVFTDGDFRRWLLGSNYPDLNLSVNAVANKKFVSASYGVDEFNIKSLLDDRIAYVPLLDSYDRLIAIAMPDIAQFQIGSKLIGSGQPVFVIAEIGNNHNGNIDLAKRLVDLAKESGADCVKFQMRNLDTMYKQLDSNNSSEDLGAQYTLDLLSKFQLTNDDLCRVFDYAVQNEILPLCTPWDEVSLSVLEDYGLEAYKLASADLTNHDLILKLTETRKPLICSTGMSSDSEISETVKLLKDRSSRYSLLHCNSTYPAPFKDINLNYLSRLKEIGYGAPVGYSGHERGYSVVLAAVAMGASIIEKHFTVDKSMEGNDHKVSLLPKEFSDMVRHIREVELALGTGHSRVVTQGEMMNREVLAKSLVAAQNIQMGEMIVEDYIQVKSPGKGLSPNNKKFLIGRKSPRNIIKGDFFYDSDLSEKIIEPRQYKFNRLFGVPVRYHDIQDIAYKSNFNLLEFHLSYKDLELDPKNFLANKGYDMNLIVHSPELFAGDHVLNLASLDKEYRRHSILELQKVIDVTKNLKRYFHRSSRPMIVVNVGGFTSDKFVPKSKRTEMYKLVADAFQEVDSSGVELIPQTMPPYPWHFGGQQFHNLFISCDEIIEFCRTNQVRVCLDISHSKLACNFEKFSFSKFLDYVLPYVGHMHIVDAKGVDGEGLQIDSGEIDFYDLGNKLKTIPGDVGFIPEIWQGHKNNGEGFWVALDRLEKYFN